MKKKIFKYVFIQHVVLVVLASISADKNKNKKIPGYLRSHCYSVIIYINYMYLL